METISKKATRMTYAEAMAEKSVKRNAKRGTGAKRRTWLEKAMDEVDEKFADVEDNAEFDESAEAGVA